MADMAMTLRLTEEETEALRMAAEREGVSMQEFAQGRDPRPGLANRAAAPRRLPGRLRGQEQGAARPPRSVRYLELADLQAIARLRARGPRSRSGTGDCCESALARPATSVSGRTPTRPSGTRRPRCCTRSCATTRWWTATSEMGITACALLLHRNGVELTFEGGRGVRPGHRRGGRPSRRARDRGAPARLGGRLRR